MSRSATRSSESKLSKADAEAWLRQFPYRGHAALGLHALLVLGANGFVFWLLHSGRLSGAGLILLVALETVLLLALTRLMALPVPLRDWFEAPKPMREVLPVLAFLVVWCAGAYGITLLMISGWPDFLAYFRDPRQWLRSGLAYALAITVVLALVAGTGDYLRYRRLGAPYMSSLSLDAMARMLTLVLGGIPFAMPFFVVTIGGFKAVEWLAARARTDPRTSILGGLGMLAVAVLGFAAVSALIGAGTSGWAIGFVLAKLLAELMVVAIPLVMREAAAGK
jgi:hypothetical protein